MPSTRPVRRVAASASSARRAATTGSPSTGTTKKRTASTAASSKPVRKTTTTTAAAAAAKKKGTKAASSGTKTKVKASPKSKAKAPTDYEVELVLGHQFIGKGDNNLNSRYLVKWLGYADKENTWEPAENINAPALVAAYWSKAAVLAGEEIESMQQTGASDDGDSVDEDL